VSKSEAANMRRARLKQGGSEALLHRGADVPTIESPKEVEMQPARSASAHSIAPGSIPESAQHRSGKRGPALLRVIQLVWSQNRAHELENQSVVRVRVGIASRGGSGDGGTRKLAGPKVRREDGFREQICLTRAIPLSKLHYRGAGRATFSNFRRTRV
jgi:hypothetical protein